MGVNYYDVMQTLQSVAEVEYRERKASECIAKLKEMGNTGLLKRIQSIKDEFPMYKVMLYGLAYDEFERIFNIKTYILDLVDTVLSEAGLSTTSGDPAEVIAKNKKLYYENCEAGLDNLYKKTQFLYYPVIFPFDPDENDPAKLALLDMYLFQIFSWPDKKYANKAADMLSVCYVSNHPDDEIAELQLLKDLWIINKEFYYQALGGGSV
jgi:hypothetical protein